MQSCSSSLLVQDIPFFLTDGWVLKSNKAPFFKWFSLMHSTALLTSQNLFLCSKMNLFLGIWQIPLSSHLKVLLDCAVVNLHAGNTKMWGETKLLGLRIIPCQNRKVWVKGVPDRILNLVMNSRTSIASLSILVYFQQTFGTIKLSLSSVLWNKHINQY